ncbi:hypothetical protein ACHAWO_002294 [Cyclotella atomus]|uniref:Uncharacterized protein n=1 Tax=Cyclotella atomus TaxID=382360 RepID=A0ABD3MVK3_9STRA
MHQDMRCNKDEAHMECKPDPSMQMTGVASESADARPPPFFCGPRPYFPFTGFYDSMDNTIHNDVPLANAVGRTDVEQCCWWGRGSARAAGVCLFGKLNYYLSDVFPGVDFCKNPSSVCSGSFSYTLMWITGMFVWVEYAQSDALYSDALDRFVQGETTEQEVIDVISDLLDNGMNKEHRLANFQLTLNALEIEYSSVQQNENTYDSLNLGAINSD